MSLMKLYLFGIVIIMIDTVNSYSSGSCNSKDFSVPKNCSCSIVANEYDMECPLDNPVIRIRIVAKTNVQIECQSVNNNIYLNVPEMNLPDVSTVRFRRCPLPINGDSLQTVLNRLGIKDIRALYFTSARDGLSETLAKHHLNGLTNLTRLHIDGNSITNLPENLFTNLDNLTWLFLNGNHLHLPLNIFKPLEKMEFLELGNNKLDFLEPGVFKYQKKLKKLNLWDNNFHNLTKQSFMGAESVEELDLSSSNIKNFVSDIFSDLINLTNINISLNNFSSLPIGLFANNKQLNNIRLNDNRENLSTLPKELLANLPKLKTVHINTGLETIPGDLFTGSTEIETIELTKNKLQILPKEIFQDLRNLIKLDLSYNELIELDDVLFKRTDSLKELRLSFNNLTIIQSSIFDYLTNLEIIYLDNNKLHTIDTRSFSNTINLQRIELNNNELTFASIDGNLENIVISPFSNIFKLEHLNLSHNKIVSADKDWLTSNAYLKILDLSYNNISFIHATSLHFAANNLKLNLSHNMIKEINFEDFFIENPDTISPININLNNNPIMCDCLIYNFIIYFNKFKNQNNKRITFEMDKLYCNEPENMQYRQIETIKPEELLCSLDSPNTNEKYCPAGCNCLRRPFDNTLILNCSNANLNIVPQVPILNEIKLIEFYLDNNNLIALPSINNKTNSGYNLVTQLNVANNGLNNIQPENLPSKLKLLNLTNNQLQSLNQSVLDKLTRNLNDLDKLYLSGNPWQCDCTTTGFLTFCLDKRLKIQDYSKIRCENDGKLLNEKIDDYCPKPVILIIILSLLLALFGFLIGIMAALYYKYQIEIKIWLFDKKLFTRWVNEYDVDVNMIYDAFVAYSHLDEDFVTQYILPELEMGTPKYKLCLHERDWKIGNAITESIADSVAQSRRTIIILSQNFLESDWAKLEFRIAYEKSMAEKRSRLIVIIYGDQEIDKDKLDNELKAYLNTNTYIKWGDKWFWKRLRYALPHPNGHRLQPPNGLLKSQLKGSTDDKLELIKPISITPPLTTPPAELASDKFQQYQFNNSSFMMNGHVNGAFIINTNAKQSDV